MRGSRCCQVTVERGPASKQEGAFAPQEIELKRLLIGAGAAEKLLGVLGPPRTDHEQVNHVFDTPEQGLRKSRHSLRLREENGTFSLTAKGPSRQLSGDVRTRTEAEATIEPERARQLLRGQLDPLVELRARATDPAFAELWRELSAAIGGAPVRQVGQFSNRRRTVAVTVPAGIALCIEVDQTRFPDGRVDEEVEIELDRAELCASVEAWLAATAAAAGIETQTSSAKLARFYAAIESTASPGAAPEST